MTAHPKTAPHRADPKHGDPGHIYAPDEWTQIQADAARHGAHPAPVHPGLLTLGRSSFPSVTGFVQCKYDGGPQPAGGPKFGVLHDAETPLANGYAASIASYFTRNTNSTSAHFMVGPDASIQLLDTGREAWHCGTGNQRSIGVEQTGYATAMPAADWTDPAGLAQMGRVAALMRDIHAGHGIGLFWMSDQQLRDAFAGRIVGGWATHDQCRRVLGGTTHTDPMPNYPLDQLMATANEEDDMPTAEEIAEAVWNRQIGGVKSLAGNPVGPAPAAAWIQWLATVVEPTVVRNTVWNAPIDDKGNLTNGGPWASTRLAGIDGKTGDLEVKMDALTALAKDLSAGGVDPQTVIAGVLAGLNGAKLSVQSSPAKS